MSIVNCFYKNYIDKTKPKKIFNRLIYYIWVSCGVSPSGLTKYLFENDKISSQKN